MRETGAAAPDGRSAILKIDCIIAAAGVKL
jgi:hypothetical protein